MIREDRKKLIEDLELARGSKILTYICSTRANASYEMEQINDTRLIFNHLKAMGQVEKLDLIVHSFGGVTTTSWRLVNLIRQYAKEFNVIVPLHAFSSATLLAMGADSIVMLPAASLGPTDPASNSFFNPSDGQNRLPINVEDLSFFIKFLKEDLRIKEASGPIEALKILSQSDSRIHPLALGAAKRGTKLAAKYSKELLSTSGKYNPTKIREIVKTFGSDLYAHDHSINRTEAEKHGLNVVSETQENEDLIWELFEGYETLMGMDQVLDYTAEFIKVTPSLPLSTPNNLQPVTSTIPEINTAVIESSSFAHINKREYDVTGMQVLTSAGLQNVYSWVQKSNKWEKEI